jgi:ribosomal protein L21E
MMRGDRVRVKLLPNLPDMKESYRGRIGTVVEHSEPGGVIMVEFGDETIAHPFTAEELDKIEEE